MRIAVAANEKTQTSEISARAGRAAFYLIFDGEGVFAEAVVNPFSTVGGGAGIGVAKMLANKQVTAIIAGKFGRNMSDAMKEKDIQAYEMEGSAAEAAARVAGGGER
jgi:predicted Fe-Mo cluster-binding NifX family protein